MSTAVRLRTAVPGDAETLRGLHRRASFIWPEDRHHLEAHPEVFGVSPEALEAGQVRIAEDEQGTVLGFATARPLGDATGELEDLFVEPPAMRRGIGRALVDDAAARGVRAGWTHLHVTAHERTLRFYTRAGFHQTGTAATQFGPALRLTRVLAER